MSFPRRRESRFFHLLFAFYCPIDILIFFVIYQLNRRDGSAAMVALIILFDGECNLCSAAVQFVLLRDRQQKFRFASLQSPAGQRLLRRFGLPETQLDSIVLIKGDHYYLRSEAALHIAKELPGAWWLLYSLRIVPRHLRDFVYDIIAKYRYRWFGKRPSCLMPSAKNHLRFIQS